MNNLFSQSTEILDSLLQTSHEVLAAAETENWPLFVQATDKRTRLMNNFQETHQNFTAQYGGKLDKTEKDRINGEINVKIKNIAKVDSKILDIVSREKNKISQKVNLANQGKTFLKNYQKRINSQSTVFQTM